MMQASVGDLIIGLMMWIVPVGTLCLLWVVDATGWIRSSHGHHREPDPLVLETLTI